MLTRTARPLFAVTVLAALLAPRLADACSPPYGYTIQDSWPAKDAAAAPIDGVIVILGAGESAPQLTIEVLVDGAPVAGKFEDAFGRNIWRADAPFAPNTLHVVHVESPDEGSEEPFSEYDFSFTTGAEKAAPPVPGAVLSATPEAWEMKNGHCEDDFTGSCSCENWVVDSVEQRMRLALSVAAPQGPFDGVHLGRVAVGPSVDALKAPEGWSMQNEPGEALGWLVDLGLQGAWPGDEVCFQVEIEDPTGQKVLGEPSCVDISELNVEPPPPEPTTGEPETTGEPPETSSDSDSDSAGEDKEGGCECRSDVGGGWSGLLALLGLGLVRPRRRR